MLYSMKILTYKDSPRARRVKIFIMTEKTLYRYLIEAKISIYDDFKLKKPLVSMVHTKILFSFVMVNINQMI